MCVKCARCAGIVEAMRQITRLALVAVSALLVSACADDEFIPPQPTDAATDAAAIDAPDSDAPDATDATAEDAPIDAIRVDAMTSVNVVQCPGNPDLAISAATGVYVPSTATINVNDVVRFTPGDPNHDMVSGTPGTPDGRFATPLGQTTCLRFTAAGTFPFFCTVHSFTGTITVN